jgi:hypothetical protein
MKLIILAGHRSMNLVWDPLCDAPSAPSIRLFSQSIDALKVREWIEWKKKGLKREC